MKNNKNDAMRGYWSTRNGICLNKKSKKGKENVIMNYQRKTQKEAGTYSEVNCYNQLNNSNETYHLLTESFIFSRKLHVVHFSYI